MSKAPTPRYQVGESLYGFSFAQGTHCQGKVVAINAYTVYGYTLENGNELGPFDEIMTLAEKQRVDEAVAQFESEASK